MEQVNAIAPRRQTIFMETWSGGKWYIKLLLILFIPFSIISPYPFLAIYFVSWDELRESSQRKKEAQIKEARELLRNYKVEFRTRHGFLATGAQRELIQRDVPLTDEQIDEILKTINPKDILKTEIQ